MLPRIKPAFRIDLEAIRASAERNKHGVALVQTRGWQAMMKKCNGSYRSKICSKDGTSTDKPSFCA